MNLESAFFHGILVIIMMQICFVVGSCESWMFVTAVVHLLSWLS